MRSAVAIQFGCGCVRGQATADDVDERGERARARVPEIGAELGHDGHPRATAPHLVVVFEREAQVAQQMASGRVVRGHVGAGSGVRGR